MAFFDFIKKKELEIINNQQETIASQKQQIEELQETIETQKEQIEKQEIALASANDENKLLQDRVKELEPYQAIIDTEKEIAQKIADSEALIADKMAKLKEREDEAENKIKEQNEAMEAIKREHEKHVTELQDKYAQGLEVYNALQAEIGNHKDTLNVLNCGVYEPHFDFEFSVQYQNEIYGIREQEKRFISSGLAVTGVDIDDESLCDNEVFDAYKKLMLRAFNGECDSFIAEVDWDNVVKMEQRIYKSLQTINKMYAKQHIRIVSEYADLKLKELHLVYEYKRKRHEEKEEQRAIREQMREEEKAQREIEAAMAKAQKEEDTYQKALEKARMEIADAVGEKQEQLNSQIAELEARLAEAEASKERALSMAQQTKRGHVYVISNIGSFGENIYKIGMTRRLDPMDRIKELGDASVPFPFDVHAIIFSEDAPALETQLHRVFDEKRVNLVNPRKEFYAVSLQEIEDEVHKNDAEIEFTKLAEARDYRESIAIRESQIPQELNTAGSSETKSEFPITLFAS